MQQTRIGRRGFLTASSALAAGAAATGALSGCNSTAMVSGISSGDSDEMAKMMLLVGDNGNDLKLDYLKILIDNGLPKTTKPKRVIVVGAGPAGMAAASLLLDAGHQVTVLEANGNRTGGRVKTFRNIFADPALHAEAGAMRLPEAHPLVLALADKLGVNRRVFYNADVAPGALPVGTVPPVAYRSFTGESWSNGTQVGLFRTPPATARTLIEVNGRSVTRAEYAADPVSLNGSFGVKMSRVADVALGSALASVKVSVDDPIEKQIARWSNVFRKYDDYSMFRFLLEQGWDPNKIDAVGTLENLTSRLHYALVPALVDHALIRPDGHYWELEGGTAALTDAMARKLGPAILLGKRMTRLVQTADGVQVWTTVESGTEHIDGALIGPDEKFEADYAIVAIPQTAGRFCEFEPALSYPKRRAIAELHYDSATKVLLEFKNRFWEQGSGGFTGGGCVSDSPNRFTYFPSHSPEGSRGGVVLAVYTWSDDAMRWDSLSDGERIPFALKGMEKMFGPVVNREFTGHSATQSWARARYALGEASIALPGQIHEHLPATRTVEGRVHFAGDHTSMKPAWIEGALESAVRSALEVHTRA